MELNSANLTCNSPSVKCPSVIMQLFWQTTVTYPNPTLSNKNRCIFLNFFQTDLVRVLVGVQAAAVSFAGKAGTDVMGVVADRVCDTAAASWGSPALALCNGLSNKLKRDYHGYHNGLTSTPIHIIRIKCTNTCTHMYMHAHIHTYTHNAHIHTYTHIQTHTCTHTHMYTYTHTHTYTHMNTHSAQDKTKMVSPATYTFDLTEFKYPQSGLQLAYLGVHGET